MAGGLDDLIWGHVSMRDPGGRGFWIKRAGLGLGEVTADDVQLVGWDGARLAGFGSVHVEWPIHAQVLRRRPEVGSVVHSHGRAALALMAARSRLRPVSHEGTLFVPPEVPVFTTTGDLILDVSLGDAVAEQLGDDLAMFLVRHGTIVTGMDVQLAAVHAVLLERACEVQLRAMAAAGSDADLDYSEDAESLAKREHCWSEATRRAAWEHLVRSAPSYGAAPK